MRWVDGSQFIGFAGKKIADYDPYFKNEFAAKNVNWMEKYFQLIDFNSVDFRFRQALNSIKRIRVIC